MRLSQAVRLQHIKQVLLPNSFPLHKESVMRKRSPEIAHDSFFIGASLLHEVRILMLEIWVLGSGPKDKIRHFESQTLNEKNRKTGTGFTLAARYGLEERRGFLATIECRLSVRTRESASVGESVPCSIAFASRMDSFLAANS